MLGHSLLGWSAVCGDEGIFSIYSMYTLIYIYTYLCLCESEKGDMYVSASSLKAYIVSQ